MFALQSRGPHAPWLGQALLSVLICAQRLPVPGGPGQLSARPAHVPHSALSAGSILPGKWRLGTGHPSAQAHTTRGRGQAAALAVHFFSH